MEGQNENTRPGAAPEAPKKNPLFEKYKSQVFPCYRHHKKNGSRRFENLDELMKAGDGWEESPKAAGLAV